MNFKREPAVILAIIAAALGLVVTFNPAWLTADQSAAALVAINAIAGLVTAFRVRPFAPTAATYAATCVFELLAAYHFAVPPATIGAFNVLIVAAVAGIVWPNSTPKADPRPLAPISGTID